MILAQLLGLGFLEDVLVRGGEVEPGRGALAAQGPEQYSTVQYSTVQYSTVQYSTVQYTVLEQLLLRLGQLVPAGGDQTRDLGTSRLLMKVR